MLAIGYLVLVQAIVRRPLVAVSGPGIEPFLVEAVLGGVALLALLVMLALLHQVARPLVEGVAWLGLDSLLATSGSDSPAHGLNGANPTVAAEPAGQSTLVGETQPAANRLEQGRRSLA